MSRKSQIPECVACLSKAGLGIKRIVRQTGLAKTSVGRFMRARGLTDEFIAHAKRAQVNATRKTKAVKVEPLFRLPGELKVPLTREEKAAKALAYYYKNHETRKEQGRANAMKQWQDVVIGSDQHLRRCLSMMIHKTLKSSTGQGKSAHGYTPKRLVGCSWKSLRFHISTLLSDGMDFDSYASAWMIDCVRPAHTFDLSNPAQQLLCFNWRNLAPRWKLASDGAQTRRARQIMPTPPGLRTLFEPPAPAGSAKQQTDSMTE